MFEGVLHLKVLFFNCVLCEFLFFTSKGYWSLANWGFSIQNSWVFFLFAQFFMKFWFCRFLWINHASKASTTCVAKCYRWPGEENWWTGEESWWTVLSYYESTRSYDEAYDAEDGVLPDRLQKLKPPLVCDDSNEYNVMPL